jgi:hypothetical protein
MRREWQSAAYGKSKGTGALIASHELYSVWSEKSQAEWQVKNTLTEHHDWISHQPALTMAVRALLETDKVKECIALINAHSEMVARDGDGGYKLHIEIIESEFRGCIFE